MDFMTCDSYTSHHCPSYSGGPENASYGKLPPWDQKGYYVLSFLWN